MSGLDPETEERIGSPASDEAEHEIKLTPAEAVARMRINVPSRANRKLRTLIERVNNDTQLKATVPNNASTGDVIVTVNGEKSNGVNFEVVAQCSATQNAGGDVPDTRTIELGKPAGSFVFHYDTYGIKDRIIVRYQNNVLFDTGCVGA